jgi:hypothetical protein
MLVMRSTVMPLVDRGAGRDRTFDRGIMSGEMALSAGDRECAL